MPERELGQAIALVEEAQRSARSVARETLAAAVDTLGQATADAYANEADSYADARREDPSDWDCTHERLLLKLVREQIASGRISTEQQRWRLLDVGAGDGHDAVRLA